MLWISANTITVIYEGFGDMVKLIKDILIRDL